jgi:hypothetical protein
MNYCTISGAELATIILCTCFPMMPRLVKHISDKYPSAKSSLSSLPGRAWKKKMDEAKASKDAYSTSSDEEAATKVKSPYKRLGEERNDTRGQKDKVRNMGIHRTVDIEMTTRDRVNEEGRAASMV